MFSYTRGILVAYRDVLNMIELLDFKNTDDKANALKEHIARRIETYLNNPIINPDID